MALKRSRQVSDRLVKGVGFLMKKNNIDVVIGTAKITAPGNISVVDAEDKATQLKSKHIIVATGANPIIPKGWKVDGNQILTYREAILQDRLPKSVIVIGSGAIGVEFSTIWNSWCGCTIVEMHPLVPWRTKKSADWAKPSRSRVSSPAWA
jgi:dihydrolipoamide dehydrogenase